MAASSAFVLRLTSSGVDDILSALRGVAGNSAEAKRALDTLSDAVGRSGASLSDLQSGAGKASAAAVATDRDLAKLTTQLNRLAAEGDPAVASMQKLAQAEQLLAQAAAKGVPVTAQQMQGIEALRRRNEQLATSMAGAGTAITTANDNAAASFGRFRAAAGQAGYQVQDFVVQVQGGQSALVALSQQGSQLLGVFGPTGAIAGAALTIGLLAVQIISGLDATKRWTEAIDAQEKGLQRASDFAKEWRDGLKDEADKVKELAEYYDSLADARRQYEIRAAQRDQVLLTEQQGTFTRDVTGQLGGLTAGFSDQIEQMRLYAAKAYGTGSEEYRTIMSDPDIERMQRAVEVVNNFNQAVSRDGRASVDALAELTTSLRSLADQGSDPASRSILRAADEMEKMDPKARELATAARQLEERLQALGLKAGEAADRAAKLRAEMDALARRALENPTAAIDGDIGKIEAQIAALQKGSAAYRSVIADQDQVTRANIAAQKARDELTKSLKDAGKSEDDIKAALDAQGPAIDAAANRYATLYRRRDDLNKQVTESEAAAERRAKAAERSASQEIKAAERVAAERARIDAGRDPETGYSNDVTVRLDAMRKTANEKAQREEEKKQKEAQHALEKQQLEAEKATDSIVDYAGDRFADLFSENSKGWKGMLDTFEQTAKATGARVLAELTLRPIISPIVSGVMGYANENGYLSGSSSGASNLIASAGGGVGGTASQVAGLSGSISKLSDAASGIGKIFGGNGGFQTGYAGVDRYLNTPIYNSTYGLDMSSSGASAAMSGASPGLTYGQAAGAGLGIVGGAYGIYQGIQTGGAKGAAQGISGAAGVAGGAATLATGLGAASGAIAAVGAVAPYVAVAALIASYFLSGQKPSDKTGTSTLNFLTGQQEEGGLSGARYDKANRNEAASIAASGWQIQDTYKDLMGLSQNVPLAYQISVGNRDGIGLRIGDTTQTFERTDEGSQELAKALTKAIIDAGASIASQDVKNVVTASGDDIDTITANLQWYKNTYQAAIKDASGKTSEFQQALDALTTQFDPMIGKAASLGLETEKLTDALDKARQAVIDNRQAQLLALEDSFDQRNAAATGQSNSAAYQMAQFNKAAEKAAQDLYTQLRLVQGLTDEEAVPFQQRLGSTQALEREALQRQLAAAQASNDNALWDRIQSATGNSDTLQGARWDYERKAQAAWVAAVSDGMTDLTLLARTQAEERLAIERTYAEKSEALRAQSLQAELSAMQTLASQSKVLTGWLDSQKLTSSLNSPSSALAEAQRQLSVAVEAARVAGPAKADLSAVTSAASSVISAGSAYYGTSSGQAAIETMVRQTVNSLGAQLDLPAWTDDVVGAVARVVAAQESGTAAIVSEIQQLRDEFVKLRLRMAA